MRAIFKPSKLCGNINVPPSKSVAHRYLLGAALTGENCVLSGVDYSEDIMATVDCLDALGVGITTDGDKVTVSGKITAADGACLNCRESGSTLRFLIPIALCSGKRITFCGSKRLFERPLDVYAELCRERGFTFEMGESSLTVCGELKSGDYKIRPEVSSQFISGLIFALVYLNGEASVEIIPPFESKPYVDLTLDALRNFGADVGFTSEYKIEIKPATLHGLSCEIEGDYSNAAFLDAFNYTGSQITLCGLSDDSLQGDRVYREYFEQIMDGTPTLDVSDCPDLAPILIALAALRDGATLTGTDRLAAKESDRGASMHAELSKLCGGLVFGDNSIIVPKQDLAYSGVVLDGHNDHRIVMALSVILSHIGGEIDGIEAVKKSYPRFFEDIKTLGAEVEIK
jgi:3-phosphoshikimate 1-carboxyvinyltransferase